MEICANRIWLMEALTGVRAHTMPGVCNRPQAGFSMYAHRTPCAQRTGMREAASSDVPFPSGKRDFAAARSGSPT
eukprot:2645669-Rhodomonas_salina.1